MKKSYKIFCIIITTGLINLSVFAQGLSIGSETTFTLGTSTLSLPGNLFNGGIFNPGNGTIVFNGSNGNQSFSGNNGDIFYNISVNKSAGDVQLANNINVNGSLSVISGDFDANNKTVTLGSNASLIENEGNRFKGGFVETTRILNAPNSENIMGVQISSAANLGNTIIVRGHTVQTGNGNSGISRYFDINPSNNSNLNAILVFHYNDNELNGLPEQEFILFKSADAGLNWTSMGGVLDQQSNTVTLGGVNSLSRWTLAANSVPIPVELISFTAAYENNRLKLNWDTKSEVNNLGFEIEKKSTGSFEMIGFVPGSGTATENHSYYFIDDKLIDGIIVYRLKQINYDASFSYSDEIEVDLAFPEEFELSQNYPNPFNPSTIISYSIRQTGNVKLVVYDILGKEIATLVNEEKERGVYVVSFDASQLASGMYLYRLHAGKFSQVKKMIINK